MRPQKGKMGRTCSGLSSLSFAILSVEPVLPDCSMALLENVAHISQIIVTAYVHPFIISRFQDGYFSETSQHRTINTYSNSLMLIRASEHTRCLFQNMFVWLQIGKQSKAGCPFDTTRPTIFSPSFLKVLYRRGSSIKCALSDDLEDVNCVVGSFCWGNLEQATCIYKTVNF